MFDSCPNPRSLSNFKPHLIFSTATSQIHLAALFSFDPAITIIFSARFMGCKSLVMVNKMICCSSYNMFADCIKVAGARRSLLHEIKMTWILSSRRLLKGSRGRLRIVAMRPCNSMLVDSDSKRLLK